MSFWRSQWPRLKIGKWLISRRRTPVGPTPQVSVASGKVMIKVFMDVKINQPPIKHLNFLITLCFFVLDVYPYCLKILWNIFVQIEGCWSFSQRGRQFAAFLGSFFFSRLIFVLTLILGSQWPQMKNEIIWLLQNWLANSKRGRTSMF